MSELRVVVADPDPSSRALLVAQVEQLGHSAIAEAENRVELLEVVYGCRPDVVVLSWWLPEPSDAQAAMRAIAGTSAGIRLIAIVDEQMEEDRAAARAAGATSLLASFHTTMEMMLALECSRPAERRRQPDPRPQESPQPAPEPQSPAEPAASQPRDGRGMLKRAV